jgi:hypothetical protein
MELRNVRLEPGFKGGSVIVPCGVCGIRRRRPGRLYTRWILAGGKHKVGTVCRECLEEEVFLRFETRMPVVWVRKAKKGVCSCKQDARGGVKLIVEHSVLMKEERFLCKLCMIELVGW